MKFYLVKITKDLGLDKDMQVIGVVGENEREVEDFIYENYNDYTYNNLKIEIAEVNQVGNYEIIVKKRVKI